MGRGKRQLPVCLPYKLKFIRTELGLNLDEMIVALSKKLNSLKSADLNIYRSHILEFEKGIREPQLLVLLAYAKVANIYVDILLDDTLELPLNLPVSKPKTFK